MLDKNSPEMPEESRGNWSDSRKWIMGILASIVLGILGWIGIQIANELGTDEVLLVEQISPADGSTFSHFPRTLNLQWHLLSGTSRYIVELEAQSNGEWFPPPSQSRFVTTETSQSLKFIGAQPGRWKVTAIGKKEKIIGASPWWYFEFYQ